MAVVADRRIAAYNAFKPNMVLLPLHGSSCAKGLWHRTRGSHMRWFSAIEPLRVRHRVTIALCIPALLLLCNGASAPKVAPAAISARAFVITDPEILASFTFDRVVASLGSAQSATWLDPITAAHTKVAQSPPVVLPFAGFIPAMEADGRWHPAGAKRWSHLRPIAVVNRFDLAPADFSHCGEYRLIFSRREGGGERLYIAIETILPNPNRSKGKAGCLNVAAFWWKLAHIESVGERRDRLESFFFRGLPSFSPVFDRHTFESGGRIRTSEISNGRPKFGQFEWKRHCPTGQPCVLRFGRVPLDNMPDATLFDADAAGERAASFRRDFLRQVASLAIPDLNRYSMNIDRAYSVSDVDALVPAFNYRLPFARSQRTAVGREFRRQIAEELRKAGSTLRPEDIIDRAETQNCAGCHGKPGPVGGGQVFPKASERGEHLADDSLAASALLSPALKEVFVPYRIEVLRQYREDNE